MTKLNFLLPAVAPSPLYLAIFTLAISGTYAAGFSPSNQQDQDPVGTALKIGDVVRRPVASHMLL